MVNPKTRQPISIRDDIRETLKRIAPHAAALNSEAALDEVSRATREGNHASYLRGQFAQSGQVPAVVQSSVLAFRG